ncbi:hypothetical protein C8T65DRAFT_745239 [Cerioporus squamosus]|nr:hypothetical protein C8T65DRAFT_745239 [Cerioporus squamosus]
MSPPMSAHCEIYKSPALGSGEWTLQGCFVDTATLPAFGQPVVHHTFPTNRDLIGECVDYCLHIGFSFSGIENNSDCQGSFGLAGGAQLTSPSDCDSLCPILDGGNEFCGGFQRLQVLKFEPF